MTTSARPKIFTDLNPEIACRRLAREIASNIRNAATEGKSFTLGLATGSTPLPLYRELIRLHREENLSFRNVLTFNLDEYYGVKPDSPHSYHHFMWKNLFHELDIPSEQICIPEGEIPREQVAAYCDAYEKEIAAAGGIDLQILGIGRSGHIGFNEPPSSSDSKTRLITLHPITRQDAAEDFGGLEQVPTEAITMGISSILQSKKIALMAWGKKKAEIIARALTSQPTSELPASFLNLHPQASYYLDKEAASEFSSES